MDIDPVLDPLVGKTEDEAVPPISFQEYLTRFDGCHAEWVMGRGYVRANNIPHQKLLIFLTTLLSLYLGFKQIGQVLIARVSMYLGDDKPAREPDLLVVLNEHADRIQPTYLNGAADLVVEIVSPERSERDYGTKFVEYEAAGVREYW